MLRRLKQEQMQLMPVESGRPLNFGKNTTRLLLRATLHDMAKEAII
jgi:hypothetical protein